MRRADSVDSHMNPPLRVSACLSSTDQQVVRSADDDRTGDGERVANRSTPPPHEYRQALRGRDGSRAPRRVEQPIDRHAHRRGGPEIAKVKLNDKHNLVAYASPGKNMAAIGVAIVIHRRGRIADAGAAFRSTRSRISYLDPHQFFVERSK